MVTTLLETRGFKKDYQKLPKSLRVKVMERLELFKINDQNPLLGSHNLNPPWDGCKSINVTGNIRIVYQKHENVVLLLRVGSHSELYK